MDDSQNLSRLEQLLEDTLEVAEENNRMLNQIQRTMRWSFWGKLVLWVVLLGLPIFFLGPILKSLTPLQGAGGGSQGVFGLPSAEQLQELIDSYNSSTTGQ